MKYSIESFEGYTCRAKVVVERRGEYLLNTDIYINSCEREKITDKILQAVRRKFGEEAYKVTVNFSSKQEDLNISKILEEFLNDL